MKRNLVMGFCCLMFILTGAASAEEVGKVKYARGAVTIQQPDGSGARLIGKGGVINKGEVLKTGSKSFAIIQLGDDTKMTLRPGSSFAVEKMTAKKSSKAQALLRLFRGGLRAVTGFISKFNPNGYKIRTSVATIGIRGTKFDARLCADDCDRENKKLHDKDKQDGALAVAKVVFMRGDIKAENFKDELRSLKRMSPVFEGDTIMTGEGAYAVLVFRDKSRVTLQELTSFRVDELRYNEKKAEKGVSALFSLLRGGLRTVTGLIGRLNPTAYRMRTSIATIGIRGTGYDLLCSGECAFDGSPSKQPMPRGDGLYSHVWDGRIVMSELPVDTNESGFKQSLQSQPVKLPETPSFFNRNPAPRPDKLEVDEDKLFADAGGDVEPGLYVSVKEGKVTIESDRTGKRLDITKGMAAYAGLAGQVARLPAIPAFQARDIFPTPDNFNPKALNLSGSDVGAKDTDTTVCEVK